MRHLLLILFIPLLNLSQNLNDSIDIIKLKTIHLYDLEIPTKKTAKNTTIINSSEIENYSFQSIDELLKLIPSIEMQSRGGFGTQSDIILRGTTFNQTLVLIDGVRINDPLTGHFSMYLPINPFEIHQIEIIRGAGSSTYGSEAVGGVVNIITKSFKDSFKKSELLTETKIGANKLKGTNIYIGKSYEKLFSTISMSIIKSDGQELYPNSFSFFDNQVYSTSHRYKPNNKLSLYLRSAYSKNFFSSKYYYTSYPSDQSNELIDKSWTYFKANYKIDDTNYINIYSSYQSVNDKFIFNPESPTNLNFTELLNNKIHYIKNSNNIQIISGIDFQNRKISSIDRGNHTDIYLGGFVNVIKNINKITWNPAIRFDYNDSYKLQICPQLDVNFKQENYNLRASIARAIRSADFTERFSNNNYAADTLSPGRNIGNPDLNAETSINFEIGFDYTKNELFTWKNTLFYRNSKNLIDWVYTNSNEINTEVSIYENENYFFAQNISQLKTIGIESELWMPSFKIASWIFSGSLGYTKILKAEKFKNIFENSINLPSKYAGSSGDRLNYNLFIDWNKFKLNINGLLKLRNQNIDLSVDQDLVDDYFVHNANLTYNINHKISCSFQIINLFNKNYANIIGAIMPKRWSILSVKYFIK